MGQALEVLVEAIGVQCLDRVDDASVQRPPASLDQPPIGDLVGERVFEGVLELQEEARLVEELGGLEMSEPAAERLLVLVGDGLEQSERDIRADDCGNLQQPLLFWPSRSMREARIA